MKGSYLCWFAGGSNKKSLWLNPIWAIDLDGLEPKSVVKQISKNRYKFTELSIELLSWSSDVDKELLRNVVIRKRARPFGGPWYNPPPGGAMTSLKKIRFTWNYFKGWRLRDKYENFYYGGDDLKSIRRWLVSSAHEVRHLERAVKYKSSLGYYLSFAWEYIRYGGHNKAPREQEADKKMYRLQDFMNFMGRGEVERLFKREDLSEQEKIRQLRGWIESFEQYEKRR